MKKKFKNLFLFFLSLISTIACFKGTVSAGLLEEQVLLYTQLNEIDKGNLHQMHDHILRTMKNREFSQQHMMKFDDNFMIHDFLTKIFAFSPLLRALFGFVEIDDGRRYLFNVNYFREILNVSGSVHSKSALTNHVMYILGCRSMTFDLHDTFFGCTSDECTPTDVQEYIRIKIIEALSGSTDRPGLFASILTRVGYGCGWRMMCKDKKIGKIPKAPDSLKLIDSEKFPLSNTDEVNEKLDQLIYSHVPKGCTVLSDNFF